jgi:uncharacterized delta-60 repeat protein
MTRKTIYFVPILLVTMLGLAYAAPGELDTSFNSPNGFTTYDSGLSDGGESVAVQNDGKVVVGGWVQRSGGYDALLLRYNFDGTPDTAFGSSGVVTYDGGLSKRGVGTAIQPDGKILIVGSVANNDLFILRVNIDGIPDSTFGVNGMVTYDSGVSDLGWRIALQTDGKILVAGAMGIETDAKILLLRYELNGLLDTAFGSNGVVVYDDTMPLFSKGIAIQRDGKIVVLASKSEGDPEGSDILVLRYNPNGTPDTDFGSNGVVKYDSGQVDMGRSLAIQADGKIVVAGYTSVSAWSDYRAIVLRFNPTGMPDTSFGLNGLVEYSEGSFDAAWSLAVQPDGKIVVVGDTQGLTDTDILVLRYNGNGKLDAKFGQEGVVHYDSGLRDGAISAAISPDGGIVVCGWSFNESQYDVLLLRFRGGGFDELALDLGSLGLYHSDGTSLKKINAGNPNGLATYGYKLVANFPGVGLYHYDGTKWTRLNGNDGQEAMCATDNALYVDFGPGSGLYKYSGSWAKINANSPEQMWAVGSDLYADFGAGVGLYRYNGTAWQRMNPNDATDLCAVGSDLYIHFAGVGLYKYDGTWKKINMNAPQRMVAMGSDLYVDFGSGVGLYKYNGTTWQKMNPNDPTNMVAAGNVLYVHFSGVGLYRYDGTWKKINSGQPQQMVGVGTDLYADFGPGIGLYKYDGLAWKKINPNTAEDMIAVNLY